MDHDSDGNVIALVGAGAPMRFQLCCEACYGVRQLIGLATLLRYHTAQSGRFICPVCGGVGALAVEETEERACYTGAAMVEPGVETPFPYALVQRADEDRGLSVVQPCCLDSRPEVAVAGNPNRPPFLSSGHPRVVVRELRELGLIAPLQGRAIGGR